MKTAVLLVFTVALALLGCNQAPEAPKTRPYTKEELEYMAGARDVKETRSRSEGCRRYWVEYNGLVEFGLNQLDWLAADGEAGAGRGLRMQVCARSRDEAIAMGVARAREHAAAQGGKMIRPKVVIVSDEFVRQEDEFHDRLRRDTEETEARIRRETERWNREHPR